MPGWWYDEAVVDFYWSLGQCLPNLGAPEGATRLGHAGWGSMLLRQIQPGSGTH